uniref:Uncharacterized protein n=1 Tax=Compsopogon caeruleus TaxID=31354 RepID=A0A7S1TBY3_9RHOD
MGGEEEDAWASWNSAASSWKVQIDQTDLRTQSQNQDLWRSSARELSGGDPSPKSDWGAGLGSGTSEISSWSEWRRLQGDDGFSETPSWWSNRSDLAQKKPVVSREPEADEVFLSMASSIEKENPVTESKPTEPNQPPSARQKDDETINFWKNQ